MRNGQSIFTQVWHAINAGEDGTFGPDADRTDGYFVGGFLPTLIVKEGVEPNEEELRSFVDHVGYDDNVGLWTNEGLVYIDASRWVKDLDEAKALGTLNREKAIWDVANGEEIYL